MTPSKSGAASKDVFQTPETKKLIDDDTALAMRNEDSMIINNDSTMYSEDTERCDFSVNTIDIDSIMNDCEEELVVTRVPLKVNWN